jgi:hypothetical protein
MRHHLAWTILLVAAGAIGACGGNDEIASDDEDSDAGEGGKGGSSSGGKSGSGGATGGKGGTGGSTGGQGGSGGSTGGTGGKGGTGGSTSGTGGTGGTVNNTAACNAVQTKLNDCDLQSGMANCALAPRDRLTACLFACFTPASCTEIESTFCTLDPTTNFGTCLSACQNVILDCGDGTTYAAGDKCDGTVNCASGADEALCDVIDCQDGTTVPLDYECDGVSHCSTGADEADCATLVCSTPGQGVLCSETSEALSGCGLLDGPTFQRCVEGVPARDCELACLSSSSCTELDEYYCGSSVPVAIADCFSTCDSLAQEFSCGSGELIPSTWQCDDYPDCIDDSDENNCDFQCPDGVTIVDFTWLCDGYPDCTGGEDELGCRAVCAVAN